MYWPNREGLAKWYMLHVTDNRSQISHRHQHWGLALLLGRSMCWEHVLQPLQGRRKHLSFSKALYGGDAYGGDVMRICRGCRGAEKAVARPVPLPMGPV